MSSKDRILDDLIDYASKLERDENGNVILPPNDGYLRLTEETNALDYLEKAYGFVEKVDIDVWNWKWVVISLYGALYGFAICACRGTNPDNVKKQTKRGSGNLIDFDQALSLCQNPKWMRMTVDSKPLQLTKGQKKSVRMLKYLLRDEFEHYKPKGWSIELDGMPQIIMDVLDVICFLALDTGNYVNLTEAQMDKIKNIVNQCKIILQKNRLYKETKHKAKKWGQVYN